MISLELDKDLLPIRGISFCGENICRTEIKLQVQGIFGYHIHNAKDRRSKLDLIIYDDELWYVEIYVID